MASSIYQVLDDVVCPFHKQIGNAEKCFLIRLSNKFSSFLFFLSSLPPAHPVLRAADVFLGLILITHAMYESSICPGSSPSDPAYSCCAFGSYFKGQV